VELSVVVPCLNEEDNLDALVRRVGRAIGGIEAVRRDGGELILVDDGSADRTWDKMHALRRGAPFVVPQRHAKRRGIAEAWRTGVRAARGRLVCVLDADLQYEPEEIPRLHDLLERSQADIVQGARVPVDRPRDSRYWLSRGLNSVLNRTFGMNLRDNKSGFLVTRREVFVDLLDYRGDYAHWQVFIMVAARARGYRAVDTPTPFRPRVAGRSAFGDVPFGTVAQVCVDVVRAAREYGARRGATVR
jgi:phenylacetate-CoA ligase